MLTFIGGGLEFNFYAVQLSKQLDCLNKIILKTTGMEELVLINKYFTITTFQEYLEKHPEDIEKWLEHFEPLLFPHRIKNTARTYDRRTIPKQDYSKYNIVAKQDIEVRDSDIMCGICKNSWEETPLHATTTLLCGHKYHTVCYFMLYYESEEGCQIEGCSDNTRRIVGDLYRMKSRLRQSIENTLIDNIKTNREFKNEVRKLKSKVSSIVRHVSAFSKAKRQMRKNIIKKHECNLSQIQFDINNSFKLLNSSREAKALKSEIHKYRIIERGFFRRYHLSLHDLTRYGLVGRINWVVRGILMRHYGYSSRTRRHLGIRLVPGRRTWIQHDNNDGSDSEAEEGDAEGGQEEADTVQAVDA